MAQDRFRTGIFNYVNAPADIAHQIAKPRTVSGRVGARSIGKQLDRHIWSPIRSDSNQTLQNMQSTRNVMRCQLGADFRINENLTAAIPGFVLPDSLKKPAVTPRAIDQPKED